MEFLGRGYEWIFAKGALNDFRHRPVPTSVPLIEEIGDRFLYAPLFALFSAGVTSLRFQGEWLNGFLSM